MTITLLRLLIPNQIRAKTPPWFSRLTEAMMMKNDQDNDQEFFFSSSILAKKLWFGIRGICAAVYAPHPNFSPLYLSPLPTDLPIL